MRFLIEGRLRPSCGLTPAEYFALAVKEWEMVLGWLSSGVALAYGRPVSVPGGTLLVDVSSEADGKAARFWSDQIDLHDHSHGPSEALIDTEQHVGGHDPIPAGRPNDHEGDR